MGAVLTTSPTLSWGAAGRSSFYSNKATGISTDLSQDAQRKLQALLDNAGDNGGGSVIITPGSYRLDSELKLHDNTRLVLMAGAWLYRNWTTENPDWSNATIVNEACSSQKSYITSSGTFMPRAWNSNVSVYGHGGLRATPEAMARSRARDVYCGPNIAFVGVRNSSIGGGLQVLSSKNCWNIAVHGEQVKIDRVSVRGGRELYEDGIHIIAGRDISISNSHIESGDDALAFGTSYNQPISGVTVDNVVVLSSRAYALKFVQNRDGITRNFPNPDQKIKDVTVRRLRGSAGLHRNGLISVLTPQSSPDLISDLDLDVDLRHGYISSHDGVAPHGLDMRGGTRIMVSGRFRNVIRRSVFVRQNSTNVAVNLICDAPQDRIEPAAILDSENISLSGLFPCNGSDAVYAKDVSSLQLRKFIADKISSNFGVLKLGGTTNVDTSGVVAKKADNAVGTYAYRVEPGGVVSIRSSGDDYSALDNLVAPGERPRHVSIVR
jgi:polygalacturonase